MAHIQLPEGLPGIRGLWCLVLKPPNRYAISCKLCSPVDTV